MQVCRTCGHAYPETQGFCEKCHPSRCHVCGFENEANAKYCVNCGRKLRKLNACVCGADNAEDAVFCYACGRPLAGRSTPAPPIPRNRILPVVLGFAGAFLVLSLICLII